MNEAILSPAITGLLLEAAEWRLLGLAFEYPSAEWRANLEALLPSLHAAALRGIAEAALEHNSAGLHLALFGPSGNVPVREVAWLGGVQFGYLMAELSSCYEAFGFTPGNQEAADHLSVQAGFVSYLKMKQAFALAEGDEERAAVTADAVRNFLHEHIAVQAEPVSNRLNEFAPPFLIEAGRLLLTHAGPSAKSAYPLGGECTGEDADGDFSCGPAPVPDALIQLEP